MGSLLKKSWKKIVIIIGAVILAFSLYFKIAWKPTVVEDYVNSDIEIERDVIDKIKDTSNDAKKDIKELNESTMEKDGSRSVIGWIIIFGLIVGGILVLDLLMQPNEKDKKKK